ncbi:MAG: hypothetical protein ACLSCS_09060 [Eubacterium sp.]
MKTKAKKFSHKLLALFMAVLMAASCLTCAFSAHAAPVSSEKQYTDDALEYNDLAWNILSDEQAATAFLTMRTLCFLQLLQQFTTFLQISHPALQLI